MTAEQTPHTLPFDPRGPVDLLSPHLSLGPSPRFRAGPAPHVSSGPTARPRELPRNGACAAAAEGR